MKPKDRPARAQFAETMLNNVAKDDGHLEKICFSDKATVPLSGLVNRHKVWIWGTEHQREHLEEERKSPKLTI